MDVVVAFGNAGPESPPTPAALRNAALVNFGRHPDSPAARTFATATAPMIVAHMVRTRALGRKGLDTLNRDLGIILAGVLRPGLMGAPVRAHAGFSGTLWDGADIGFRRFWSITDALIDAGLVGRLTGVKTPGTDLDGRGGLATALWPTPALVDLAASHGITADTRKDDWRADAAERAAPRNLTYDHLATCRPVKGAALGMTPDMMADLARMGADLHAINDANAKADIRGAGHTVTMVRRFRHSLGFGGRFYAPVSTMSPEDRRRITINGEPVAEVDVKASQLTVLLGIAGQREAPQDAYDVPGIPRVVVKAWVIQTLGAGRPTTQWSRKGIGPASGIKPRAVWEALRPLYPFLADLVGLAPPDLLATLPDKMHSWAAGQWITQCEAGIIAQAMTDLSRAGVPVLPIHDSLVVPSSAAPMAARALEGAFMGLVGIMPGLKVDDAGSRAA